METGTGKMQRYSLCRDGVWKAKAHLEFNLKTDEKRSKKGFYGYIKCKRNCVEMLHQCLNAAEAVMRKDYVTHCLHLSLYW